jgi:cold shock CspA family protein
VASAFAPETEKGNHLYISVHAVKRSGLASLDRGDKIRFRREVSKYPGRKAECQDIEILERAV